MRQASLKSKGTAHVLSRMEYGAKDVYEDENASKQGVFKDANYRDEVCRCIALILRTSYSIIRKRRLYRGPDHW